MNKFDAACFVPLEMSQSLRHAFQTSTPCLRIANCSGFAIAGHNMSLAPARFNMNFGLTFTQKFRAGSAPAAA